MVTRAASAPRVLTLAAMLALLAACATLATVLAWWGWRWLGPQANVFVPAAPQDPALVLLASGLFAPPHTSAAPAAPARSGNSDLRLLGVLAEDDGRGSALFRLPGGPRLVAAGGAIGDGATLVSVQRDGVTVRDADGERNMSLRAASAPVGTKASAKAGASNPVCIPPVGFKGDILRLNAELLGGIVAQPDTWATLAAADRGALTVRDDNGFTAMLAMKKGDRIEQANGIALRAPDDIVNAVLHPLTAGQSVRLVGARGGVAREWLLQNAGTCP
jgi:Type II secretion system protein C